MMGKRGRPRKNGTKEGWVLHRGLWAVHGYNQARATGVKHEAALLEAVKVVQERCPGMPIGTTWGVRQKHFYLLNVFRKRMGYPELKRAVLEQARLFGPATILIEDKASGTQLIQELISEGLSSIKKYEPKMDKVMRMHSVTSTIENGFVIVPEREPWLAEYLHELTTFPKAKYDDQADSTSQALDWLKQQQMNPYPGIVEFWKRQIAEDHNGQTK